MFTGRMINERVFSSWMSHGLASKEEECVICFERKKSRQHSIIYQTFVKEIHTQGAVPLFGVASLSVNVLTIMIPVQL